MEKNMQKNALRLRCYAKKENGYMVGVCLDLNLVVRADSFEDIKIEMSSAIKSYIDALDEKNFSDLFPRKLTTRYLLEYYFIFAICSLFKSIKSFRNSCQVFVENLIPNDFTIAFSN